MHRPIKRNANEVSHGLGGFIEPQHGITTRDAKRLRQGSEDQHNIGSVSDPFHSHQGASDPNTWDFSYPETITCSLESGSSLAWPGNNDWLSGEPLPASSFGGPSYLGYEYTPMLDLNISQEEANAAWPGFQVTIDPIFDPFNHMIPHQGVPNGLPSKGFVNEDSTGSILPLRSPRFDDAVSSWTFNIPFNTSNGGDWLVGLPNQRKSPHLNGDTNVLTESRFDEGITSEGVNCEVGATHPPHTHLGYIQSRNYIAPQINEEGEADPRTRAAILKKPYRQILPLRQGEGKAAPAESQPLTQKSDITWTHIDGLLGSSQDDKIIRRKPVRTGGLGIERAKRTAEVREIGACLRCRVMKVPCSPDEICERCKRLSLTLIGCIRNRLQDFTELFFPEIVNCYFEEGTVENLIRDNVKSGFYETEVAVQISSGPTYQPISLLVREFPPADEEFLLLSHSKWDKDGRLSTEFVRRYAPPFALHPSETKDLRYKCLEHVEFIAKGPRGEEEVNYKDTSVVSWEIFNAIHRYQRSTNNELVGQAVLLYAMHYFMTHTLVFTNESADVALRSLHFPTRLPYTHTLTSKLIILQIKRVMYGIVHESTGNILKKLDQTMSDGKKSHERAAWAASFCTISILCMCMEMIQSSTDLKVVHMMTEQEGHAELSRNASRNDDRAQPISASISMFHMVFKTHNRNGSRKNERGFNPVRYGPSMYNEKGLDKDTVALINEIRRVHIMHEDDIGQRREEPDVAYDPNDLSDLLARHLTFRERNSGKFVSRFLRSFYENN